MQRAARRLLSTRPASATTGQTTHTPRRATSVNPIKRWHGRRVAVVGLSVIGLFLYYRDRHDLARTLATADMIARTDLAIYRTLGTSVVSNKEEDGWWEKIQEELKNIQEEHGDQSNTEPPFLHPDIPHTQSPDYPEEDRENIGSVSQVNGDLTQNEPAIDDYLTEEKEVFGVNSPPGLTIEELHSIRKEGRGGMSSSFPGDQELEPTEYMLRDLTDGEELENELQSLRKEARVGRTPSFSREEIELEQKKVEEEKAWQSLENKRLHVRLEDVTARHGKKTPIENETTVLGADTPGSQGLNEQPSSSPAIGESSRNQGNAMGVGGVTAREITQLESLTTRLEVAETEQQRVRVEVQRFRADLLGDKEEMVRVASEIIRNGRAIEQIQKERLRRKSGIARIAAEALRHSRERELEKADLMKITQAVLQAEKDLFRVQSEVKRAARETARVQREIERVDADVRQVEKLLYRIQHVRQNGHVILGPEDGQERALQEKIQQLRSEFDACIKHVNPSWF